MSHECCSFCESLPGIAQAGWGGKPGKCPVCKQDLWVSQDGATYRLGGAAPVTSGKWRWVAGAGLACVCVIAGLGLYAFRSAEVTPPTKVEVALLPGKVSPDIAEVTGPTV